MSHCPHDASPLEIQTDEGHVGYRCPRCKGMWLPEKYLRSVQYERLLPYDTFVKALASAPKKDTSLNCPSGCGRLYDIVNFDPVVSWCGRCHGIWFDKGELHSLLDQIPNIEGPYVVSDVNVGRHQGLLPPYHVPPDAQRRYLLMSFIMIGYGTLGAWLDDLYIPGKRGPGVHFHGVPLWFVYGGMVFFAMNMLSIVVDHFDKQNYKRNYRRFARLTFMIAWILFVAGIVLEIFVFKSSSLYGVR